MATRRICGRRLQTTFCALTVFAGLMLALTAANILRTLTGTRNQAGSVLKTLKVYVSTRDLYRESRLSVTEQKNPISAPVLKQPRGGKYKSEMAARIALKDEFCKQRKKFDFMSRNRNISRQYKYQNCYMESSRRRFIFCPVAKVGSTFWNRFHTVLDREETNVLESPFTIPLKDADKTRCYNFRQKSLFSLLTGDKSFKVPAPEAPKGASGSETLKHLSYLKGVFVRDPFSRVFSAYIDKLLAPNPTYWRKWGKPAMELDKVSLNHVQCGHRVTFSQFIRYINDQLYLLDNHVIPLVAQCDPCQDDYDIIGHMETFTSDLAYMTSLLNVTFQTNVSLSRETKLDAIHDSVESPFGWKDNILKCASTQEMGQRIWRKLQIRGLISSKIDYPFGAQDLAKMSDSAFTQAAAAAHVKSTNKTELTRQKQQAFIEAFRTVSLSDIQRHVDIFEEDFDAFGYEKYPDAVFDRGDKFTDTHALDFSIPWRIPQF